MSLVSTDGYWCSVHGAYTPDTLIGCPACRSQPRSIGAAEAAELLSHRHHWVYDGQAGIGYLIYHCDSHDPPVVRQVWPGVTL
jgi:hypothetical protein